MQIGKNMFLTKKEEGYVDKEGRVYTPRGAQELHDIFIGTKSALSACPFCDSIVGVYERVQAEYMQYYKIDGTPVIKQGAMATIKHPKTECRCANCHQELKEPFFKKALIYENEEPI